MLLLVGGIVMDSINLINILWTLGNIALWIFILIFLIKLIKRSK